MAMTGGCSATPEEPLPPVLTSLVQREEIPFGDAISARMTRAARDVRDQLEPRWGPLEGRIYLLPADRRADFTGQMRAPLPSGWHKQPMGDDPKGVETWVSAKGNRVVAYLLFDQPAGAFYPVQILHN